jgi:hypothetical protein
VERRGKGAGGGKKKLAPEDRFAYLLCRTLGRWKHPDDMLAEMTQEEFQGWQDAYRDDPWGDDRDDLRAAANTLWHVAGMTRQDPPELVHPYFPKEETPEELDDRIKELSSAAEALKAQWQPASQN